MMSPRRSMLERLLFPSTALTRERLARSVAGKRVVITGASFGIGRAVALRLGAAGADLILIARSQDALGALVAEIEAAGGHATAIAADLIDAAVVEALATDLATRGIDILISNAGKSIRRSLFDSLDRFHDVTRTIAVNYLGPVRLILALVPALRARDGHILSISAVNVLLPPAPRWGAYQASKSAADQWLLCAEPELRAAGIATTTVYLPLVRTRMIAPTAHYARVPAMEPDQAAARICRTIVTRQRMWRPWWLPPVAVAAMLLRAPVGWMMDHLGKRAASEAAMR